MITPCIIFSLISLKLGLEILDDLPCVAKVVKYRLINQVDLVSIAVQNFRGKTQPKNHIL